MNPIGHKRQPFLRRATPRWARVREASSTLIVTSALLSGVLILEVQPVGAIELQVSNVSASVSVPQTATGTFTATGTVTNTGTVAQLAGSRVTITATNGTLGTLPSSCLLSNGAAVCTAGALTPGQAQSFGVPVSPALNATVVTTRATTSAAQPDLNAPTDPADDDVSDTTAVIYSLDVALKSEPSEVKWGRDTLLTAALTNQGIAQSGITLEVTTGGTVNLALPLPDGCTSSSDLHQVTCSNISLGTSGSQTFDIAVTVPTTGSTIESTATASGANGSGDVASAVTTMSGDSAAFLLPGQDLAHDDPFTNSVFELRPGAAAGLFLKLREATATSFPPGTMCGDVPCAEHAPEAIFPNDGPWSANDPLNPLVWNITHKTKQACAGKGTPSGCLPLYVIKSGTTTAVRMPLCPTFSINRMNKPQMVDVDTICLNFISKSGTSGFVTYQVALLKDVVIPIVSSLK